MEKTGEYILQFLIGIGIGIVAAAPCGNELHGFFVGMLGIVIKVVSMAYLEWRFPTDPL